MSHDSGEAARVDLDASRPEREAHAAARWAWWRENIESILWAVALALVIRTFIVAPFKIPSASMHPTLLEGDRILVNKFLYHFREPRRGDIIVFYHEWKPFRERWNDHSRPFFERIVTPGRPFIKRLVAVGGDTVEIRDGTIVVNGSPVEGAEIFKTTHYVNQGDYGQAGEPVRVPNDMYYVLGDNSEHSLDSRFWGFVPKSLLIGRAICIFWSPKRWRILR